MGLKFLNFISLGHLNKEKIEKINYSASII